MSWVGLEDTDGRYSGHRLRHPRRRRQVRRATPGPLLNRAEFRTRSGSGSRPTLALTTIWCESTSTVVDLGQCFTTWENYYRTAPEQAPPPNRNTPATINSLQFRSSVPGPSSPGHRWWLPVRQREHHYRSNGPGPPGCDAPIEKTADQTDGDAPVAARATGSRSATAAVSPPATSGSAITSRAG